MIDVATFCAERRVKRMPNGEWQPFFLARTRNPEECLKVSNLGTLGLKHWRRGRLTSVGCHSPGIEVGQPEVASFLDCGKGKGV